MKHSKKNKNNLPDPQTEQDQITETDTSESTDPTVTPTDEPSKTINFKSPEDQTKEYLDALQRLKAEFDNYRKRTEKERQRVAEYQQSIVIKSILPTLDAFHAAFKEENDGQSTQFVDGIRLVRDGLMDSLIKLGLVPLDVINKPYDPETSEAMAMIPSTDHPEGTVTQEITAGYQFKNRIVRPAKVIVSTSPPASAEKDKDAITDDEPDETHGG